MASKQAFHEVYFEEISDESEISETSGDEDSEVSSDKDTEIFLAGSDIDKDVFLFNAIENETPRIVKRLLKKGCNPNARYSNGVEIDVEDESEMMTPLLKAYERNRSDIAEILLKNGAEISPAVQYAVSSGKSEIIEFLLKCNTDDDDINDGKCTPLHHVIRNTSWGECDQLEAMKILLENGSDANAKDSKSNTALHYAVDFGNTDMIGLLLNHGIDIDAVDGYHQAALHQAVENKDFEVVKLLLQKGANINLKTMKLDTALHLAAESRNTKIVELLLKYDIDIDAENNTHSSALQIAAETDHTEVVKTLLINGANVKLHNETFFTAFSNCSDITRKYFLDYATNLDMNVRNDDRNTILEEDIKTLDIAFAKMIIYYESF